VTTAPPRITRLAPSPTGALHLGNARTFLINWLLARQNGWRILLRIDDLDGPRIKKGADKQAIEDLQWLGLNWDGQPQYQSSSLPTYDPLIQKLLDTGAAYPCICSRKDTERAASAPHAEDGATVYPGTCRGRFRTIADAQAAANGKPPTIRFRVPDGQVEFTDTFAGPRTYDVARQLGDFVIRKSDGTPAYQLAVVVDDVGSRVTDVVRGDDLIESTARQILLYRALGWATQIPTYCHLPLITGPDGRRLAKRHGDTRLASYREAGVPVSRILGLLARWSGMSPITAPKSAAGLIPNFRIEQVLHEPIIFTDADHRALCPP
jgi:glutamyl-tRNA synthetase